MSGGQKDRLEVSELCRISSVSEGKTCEIDVDLGSEVEGVDRALGLSLDEMM